MRPAVIIGGILTVFGLVALLWGGGITSRRNVLEVGDLTLTATERQPIPPWIAGVAVLAGLALVATNLKKRR